MRVELEPAFVLHHRPFRDTSLVLETFTRHHGRVGLVARAARGPRSRFRGLLLPFRPLLLSWRLQGELGTLTGAEAASPAAPPAGGERLLGAFYMNELVLRLTARLDAHGELFDAYAIALAALPCGEPAPVLRVFEKRLLQALGYAPDLARDEAGQPLDPQRWYRYEPGAGLTPARDDSHGALAGSSIVALAADRLDSPRALRDARRLLRDALGVHLGDRPLRTRELLARLRR